MKKFIIIIIALILSGNLKSQVYPEFNCGFNQPTGGNNSVSNPFMGLYKPVRSDRTGDSSSPEGAYFPVIIVFVQFQNDINGVNWPSGQAPSYLDSLIASPESYNNSSSWWDAYNENTQIISDLYREISRGQLHVLGKAFSVVLSRQANQYSSEASINIEIWDSLKAKIDDWEPYDLWQKGTDGKFRFRKDNFLCCLMNNLVFKFFTNNSIA